MSARRHPPRRAVVRHVSGAPDDRGALLLGRQLHECGGLDALGGVLEGVDFGDGRVPELIDTVMRILADIEAGRGTFGRLLADDSVLQQVEGAVADIDGVTTRLDAID